MKELRSTKAKRVDLVTYLSTLGYLPRKIKGRDYWYLSPLRQENTPSFKVNQPRNIWYDHGEGIGGNVIDFTMRFFHCDAKEALEKLINASDKPSFSFHQQASTTLKAGEKKERAESKITILDTRPLQHIVLLHYLEARKIPLAIAQQYCKEVDFSLYQKQHTAIGFENNSGGFELRSKTFKGSSSPKDITFFDKGKPEVYVFEGFFDFLSFAVIRPQTGTSSANSLILNSLSFFEKSRSLMEQHEKILLFLDRGTSGRLATQKALGWNKDLSAAKYTDSSNLYKYRDDLNAWLIAQHQLQQKSQQQEPPIKQRRRQL